MSDRLAELREFLPTVDRDLQRYFPFEVDEVRDSGDKSAAYNVRGHASVFNKWSLDLGGFREKVKMGAFDDVLSGDPHVLHLWDHDSRYVLSSTRNKTLELRVDPVGLHYWSRVAKTSYAEDLRVLLERGDISQSSFAFTVAEDEWRIKDQDGDEIVEREIIKVAELFDVTTTAMGAYPTTDAALAVRSMLRGRHFSAGAQPTGVIYVPATSATGTTNVVHVTRTESPSLAETPETPETSTGPEPGPVAPAGEPVGEPPSRETPGGEDEQPSVAQTDAGAAARKKALADLREEARAELEEAQRAQREIQRRKYQLTSRKETSWKS